MKKYVLFLSTMLCFLFNECLIFAQDDKSTDRTNIQSSQKKNKEKSTERKTITVITNKKVSTFLKKYGLMPWKIIYRKNNKSYRRVLNVEKERNEYVIGRKHKLKIKMGKDERVTGGDIAIYGTNSFVPDRYVGNSSKEIEITQMYLIKYLRNIKSKRVDLTKEHEYYYDFRDGGNIRQKVSLKKINIQLEKNRTKMEGGIFLKKKNNEVEQFEVFYTSGFKENGEGKIVIDIPPGEYIVKKGSKVIKKNFQWPPE